MSNQYEKKYRALLQRIHDAQANGITLFVVQKPEELGETYQDLIETLNRLADADLNLAILPREARDKPKN